MPSLFLSALYNVSVRIFSVIYDEPQVYYLGFTEPTYVTKVCFLLSADHFFASREIVHTINEEHESLSTHQQDTATAVVSEVAETDYRSLINTNNTLEHLVKTVILETHTHRALEHPKASRTFTKRRDYR